MNNIFFYRVSKNGITKVFNAFKTDNNTTVIQDISDTSNGQLS